VADGASRMLFAETVRPPRWYYTATLVGVFGSLVIIFFWSPPWPVLVAVAVPTAIAVVPNVLIGPRLRSWPYPLRVSLSAGQLRFGYYAQRMLAAAGWSMNSRAAGQLPLRLHEIESCVPRRSVRAMFLPAGSWLAVFWGFQVPYILAGVDIVTVSRDRYRVSTRHPEQLCAALDSARGAPA